MSARRFIRRAIRRSGSLHRELGVPLDRSIPLPTLRHAAKLPGRIGRQARFALELRGLRRKRHR